MPKCDIFDRSDFHDFYTLKSHREGDFGVKIFFNFRAYLGPRNFLRMLSLIGAQSFQNMLSIRMELMQILSIQVRN